MVRSRSLSKSRKRTKPIHYFPEELIFKILSWTKVTSLLRFKSVSKSWHSIISNPTFMQSHHTKSHKIPSLLMITATIFTKEEEEKEEQEEEEEEEYYERRATIVYSNSVIDYVRLDLMSPFDSMEFVSSCNGIVCVHNARCDDIYLFNPLTRLFKRLPVFLPKQKKPFRVDVVFGFDCVSDDFKVLRIAYRKDDDDDYDYDVDVHVHVDVDVDVDDNDDDDDNLASVTTLNLYSLNLYSLNADSWKEIKVGIELPGFVCNNPFIPVLSSGPVLDGVLYLEGTNEIVTFDLDKESFGVIPYPSLVHKRMSNVLDFEGSIAVIGESVRDGSVDDKEISLWTMEAVSDEVFWHKMFTFDAGSKEIHWVFMYLGDKQFVVITTKLRVMFYDYGKKETKYIGLPPLSYLVGFYKHNESLLSIKGFEQVRKT